MPELPIRIYGDPPSFHSAAGPLTALVEVEGGTAAYLLDRERSRCRVASFPGGERDRWTGPAGVLLAARRGWWGLSIRLDKIPHPPPCRPPCPPLEVAREFKRPHLPRDLASCPRCGMLVAVERAREGPGLRLVVPTRRLARRASEVLAASGLFGFVADGCKGRGRKAGLDHDFACYGLPLFRRFAAAPPRRKGGRPRVDSGPKIPPRPGRPKPAT